MQSCVRLDLSISCSARYCDCSDNSHAAIRMGLHHKPTHLSRADGQAYIIAQCIDANDPVFMVAHSTVVMPTRWYSSLEKIIITK